MKFIPTFQQLDDNIAIVRMAEKLSNGYKPRSFMESEIAYYAIGYSLGVFFKFLMEENEND